MKKKVKAIIFDVGGVLELGNPVKVAVHGHRNLGVHYDISRKLKISIDQWFDSMDSTYALATEGKISRQKTLTTIAKNLGVQTTKLDSLIQKYYRKHFKRNKQLFKQASKLKKQGYKIAILSDQWYFSHDALMTHKSYKQFNPTIVSHDVKMRKPNPKIYKLILKKLKLKPSETIFIDNQKWNIEVAKKLGMKTILFKNNKQTSKEMGKLLK